MSKRATLVWVDAQGERIAQAITTSSGVGGIESALSNHSNAGVVQCSEGLLENYSPTPNTNVYPTVRVSAQLRFINSSSGSSATVTIPAPMNNIFLSDGQTVDPSTISDIISACIGTLIAGDGSLVDTFTGGTAIGYKPSLISSIQ